MNGRLSLELRMAALLGSHPGTVRAAEATRAVIAKSVHSCLSVDWIAAHFDIDVLVVLRHPANVLASWLELDLPDRDRDLGRHAQVRSRYLKDWGVPSAGSSTVERAAWQLGLFTAALEQSAQAHPEWIVRTHERICSDTEAEFRRIFAELGLVWSPATSDLLESSDSPGSGFSLNREAALLADSWRTRLGKEQIDTLRRVLRPFPLKSWGLEDWSTGSNGDLGWLSERVPPYPVRPPDQS